MGESSPKPPGPSLPIKADPYSQLLLAEVPQDNRHKWAWPKGVIRLFHQPETKGGGPELSEKLLCPSFVIL